MGEAAMAVAEAIISSHLRNDAQPFDPAQQKFLDSFQFAFRSVWNHLKLSFSFCIGPQSPISMAPHHREACPFFMIVCSCNVLSDHDVRSAVSSAEDLPRNAKQLYGSLGCSAECGRCARTIKTIIDEALGACAEACCAGCPHSARDADAAFALAAS
jgi:bacterioferritin-associated ferredoxin